MAFFQKLRDWIDDDPSELEILAVDDAAIRNLCEALYSVSDQLSETEKSQRRLFSAPVNPNFIAQWRTYEGKYAEKISSIYWSERFTLPDGLPVYSQMESATQTGKIQARAIENFINFVCNQAIDDDGDYDDESRENIEEGFSAWERFTKEIGFDLSGVFRRRELVPFTLIPRHVSQKYGEAEKLSLLIHLQQAQEAFVFGVPFAAIALMRTILETTLKGHYEAEGVDLSEMIKDCHKLPSAASKEALHRLRLLANAILHGNNGNRKIPADLELEKEIVSLLEVLRALIEGAPTPRS